MTRNNSKWRKIEGFYDDAVADFGELEKIGRVGLIDPGAMRERFVDRFETSVKKRYGEPDLVYKHMKEDTKYMIPFMAKAQARKGVIMDFAKRHGRSCFAEYLYFPEQGKCRLDRFFDLEKREPSPSIEILCPKKKWGEATAGDEFEAGMLSLGEMGERGWLRGCVVHNKRMETITAQEYDPRTRKVEMIDMIDYGKEAEEWVEELERKYE